MKNKKLKAIAGLVAVAVIGGSLAYFNQTMTVENPFDTNKYSSELVETLHIIIRQHLRKSKSVMRLLLKPETAL